MIVLDTHVWVWWVSGTQRLPKKVQDSLADHRAQGTIRVSSISVWEVAQLVERKRLELTMDTEDWVARSEALPFLGFVPVDNRIALRSTRLPDGLHADPADRIIVATALTLGAKLITKDDRLRKYAYVETLW
ncbi:MAG: type II toxin-antitoxin system VapC family toxin [bacterium]|nr:type II toxin-antitoxin system VapC family toxin [bacterium]